MLLNSGYKNSKTSNFYKSVIEGVPLKSLHEYLSKEEYNLLQSYAENGIIKVWGLKSYTSSLRTVNTNTINRSKVIMKQLKRDDILMFVSENKYHHIGHVAYKLSDINLKLSKAIWNSEDYGYIVFIREIEDVSHLKLKRATVQSLVGLNEKSNFVSEYLDEVRSKKVLELMNVIKETYSINHYEDMGRNAQSDKLAEKDQMERLKLINPLTNFYRDYTVHNDDSFFIGIFGSWGKGKSSFVKLLTNKINEIHVKDDKQRQIEYIVSKIDCSLMEEKDTLWKSILTQLINDVQKKKKKDNGVFKRIFNWKIFSWERLIFNVFNLLKYINTKKIQSLLLIIVFLIALNLIDFSTSISFTEGKNLIGWITLVTLLISFAKGTEFILKDLLLPTKGAKVGESYFKNIEEYKQLLEVLNLTVKNNTNLRILIVLDEIDRMNKKLLPELIDITQLFKTLKTNEKKSHITIDFIFSFNHEIVFPIIGRSISQEDNELLIDSYPTYMRSSSEKIGINKYKLGKEYMDKYLDLSVYLNHAGNYNMLIDSIYEEQINVEEILSDTPSSLTVAATSLNEEDYSDNEDLGNEESLEEEFGEEYEEDVENKLVSFTAEEIQIIKNHYSFDIDPRKVIRLKNSLILLKLMNFKKFGISIEKNEYLQEFEFFVQDYLNKNPEGYKSTNNQYLEHSSYLLDNVILEQKEDSNNL